MRSEDYDGGGFGGGGEGSYSESTSTGYFQRLGQSFIGALIGVLLFLLSFVLLFWNEGNAVRRYRDLSDAKKQFVEAKIDSVDKDNDGKLVHLVGETSVADPLIDPIFGVKVSNTLKMQRKVEMYQHHEEIKSKKERQGTKETTTKYAVHTKVWSEQAINSNAFKEPKGFENPGAIPIQEATFTPKEVKLGAYTLSDGLIAKIVGMTTEPLAFPASEVTVPEDIKTAAKNKVQISDKEIYLGYGSGNPTSNQIGDVRITFPTAKGGKFSIMSGQKGDSFVPFQATNSTVELVEKGDKSAKEMVEHAEKETETLTWILRLVGFIVMAVGIYMTLNPIVMLTDFFQFLSGMVGCVIGVFSVLVALPLTLVTIAIAWIFYRPLLGLGLLAGAGVLFFLAYRFMKSRKKPSVAKGPPPVG